MTDFQQLRHNVHVEKYSSNTKRWTIKKEKFRNSDTNNSSTMTTYHLQTKGFVPMGG